MLRVSLIRHSCPAKLHLLLRMKPHGGLIKRRVSRRGNPDGIKRVGLGGLERELQLEAEGDVVAKG
jgi:hypothetical protein